MFKSARLLRLIPDKPSKGGSKTAQSTFTPNTDIRVAHNMWVYQGRWQRTPALTLVPWADTGQGITESFSIHNYLKYSLTNASLGATSLILTHDKNGSTGANYINALFGSGIHANPPIRSVTASPDECTPAVFANIKNRCFITWSGTNPFIFDGTGTDYNGEFSYDVGVEGPVSAPTYVLTGFVTRTGSLTGDYTLSVTTGSTTVVAADITGLISPIFPSNTKSAKIGGVSYATVSPGTVTSYTATVVDPTTPSCTGTIGTDQLTINGFLFPPNGEWNGLQINIASPDESKYIKTYIVGGTDTVVTLSANLAGTHSNDTWTLSGYLLNLQDAYQGGTVYQTATAQLFSGDASWAGTGPQYTYAYYDPVTGHVSNESPILQIAESGQTGVIVGLDDIMPSATTDQDRFTKIIIFRTQLAGGAVRYPLGTFGYPPTFDTIDNTGASPLTFADNHPDSDLLLNGGLSAPSVNNAKPPPSTHMMFFDQRVWLNPVGDPTAIIFSANFYEVPFGVAEESFPPLNQLRIPSDDGRVRGMKLVGNTGEITTDRYSYSIVGGPDSSSYRLVRMGPQTFGVGDYQMEELPGDIGENSAVLAYISRDSRVFLLAPSYGNVPINDPVSDIFSSDLSTPALYYDSRIHYYPATSVRLLITALSYSNMVFNFDQKTWCLAEAISPVTSLPIRPEGLTTIYGGANPVDLYVVNAGRVYSWMNVNAGAGPPDAYLETAPIDFSDGQKRRARLTFVRVYTDAPTCNVTITVDETAIPFVIPAVAEQDPAYSLYAPVAAPVDNPAAKELVAFLLKPLSDGTTIATDGFRHQARVSLPTDTSRYSIFAWDIGYQFLDDEGDVTG